MEERLIFITENQREHLKSAYNLLNRIKENISVDHEEYVAIDSSIYYLKSAINFKERNY